LQYVNWILCNKAI